MALPLPQRVPENAAGDFYVQAGLCTQCCLPHGEAPELLNDPKRPFRECHFRRQPQTPAEVDRAIDAVAVSEVCALRYGGTDPAVLRKLHARGLARQCDHTPEGQAWLAERASPAAGRAPDEAAAAPAAPLTYFTPPPHAADPALLRGMRRARKITGWGTLAVFVFASFNSADRNPLQWPAMFVFMACLLFFLWTVLATWGVQTYYALTARRRRRRPAAEPPTHAPPR